MNLITPDSGLLFWMVIIFGIVFFILWKFGFPIITGMVDKRTEHIDQSLKLAQEAEDRIRNLGVEQQAILDKTKAEQARILKEASDAKKAIIESAKEEASAQAKKILDRAKTEIAAEKEAALMDIRKEVALLSINMAEKVTRRDLSTDEGQMHYIDVLLDELKKGGNPSAPKDN